MCVLYFDDQKSTSLTESSIAELQNMILLLAHVEAKPTDQTSGFIGSIDVPLMSRTVPSQRYSSLFVGQLSEKSATIF